MQNQFSQHNREAWSQDTYEAWVRRFGSPQEAAAKIKENPAAGLRSFSKYLGNLHGQKVINLLGSHGGKAIAIALLGAKQVAVADISAENERYAREVAWEAGVELHYIVSDVLKLPAEELTGDYNLVLMEFGILHYFLDLVPLFQVVRELLLPGGRLILQDFHPISTKLIRSRGTTAKIRKHKVDGDYFDDSIEEAEVAYSKFLPEGSQEDLMKVKHRKWTLGEIVTAAAAAGLFIQVLEEEPNRSSDVFDKGIPKTFTLVAQKL